MSFLEKFQQVYWKHCSTPFRKFVSIVFEELVLKINFPLIFREEDKEHLITTFHIPRHIAIVMNYASEDFPINTKQWSIHRKLHPKVLQAMYYAK